MSCSSSFISIDKYHAAVVEMVLLPLTNIMLHSENLQVNLSRWFHQFSIGPFWWYSRTFWMNLKYNRNDNYKDRDNYKDKDKDIESLQAYLSRKFHQLSSGSSRCRLTFWMRPQFSERRVFETWYLENINYSQDFWNMKFADNCFENL